jgi:hypothetical protein
MPYMPDGFYGLIFRGIDVVSPSLSERWRKCGMNLSNNKKIV